ncbi:MAG: serine hydroxymethyltransferase, partial [Bacilli bacterium]|nr:serine hydroxymethyltransferase [Bacilli bacterium]
ILIDVKGSVGLTGLEAEKILDQINITCNKNTIPNDTESPMKTSGIRLGSPAMTTRGLKEDDFKEIGRIIIEALNHGDDKNVLDKLKKDVLTITKKYPLYEVK